MSRERIVVAGAGGFGAWAAWALRRRGHEVQLVDPWGPGNPRASSGGESRVLRAAYGKERVYSEMVARSIPRWRELADVSGLELFTPAPALWLFSEDDAYIRDSVPVLEENGLAAVPIDLGDVRRRWPQVSLGEGIRSAWIEETAGALAARESVRALVKRFAAAGGSVCEAAVRPGRAAAGRLLDVETGDGTRIAADTFLFACGPWLGELFPDVAGRMIRVTRQEILFFGTPPGDLDHALGALPIWVEMGSDVFYGIPAHRGRGFKIGQDVHGPRFEPTTGERIVSPETIERTRRYLSRRFPALAAAPVVESRVCQYSVTPDGHLLLDRHPRLENVLFAGGGSGHGFKLSPAFGELAAEVLAGERQPPEAFRVRAGADDEPRAHPAFPEESRG